MDSYKEALDRFTVSRAGFLQGQFNLDYDTLQVVDAMKHVYLVRGEDADGVLFVAIVKGDKMDTYTMAEWEIVNRLAGKMLTA